MGFTTWTPFLHSAAAVVRVGGHRVAFSSGWATAWDWRVWPPRPGKPPGTGICEVLASPGSPAAGFEVGVGRAVD